MLALVLLPGASMHCRRLLPMLLLALAACSGAERPPEATPADGGQATQADAGSLNVALLSPLDGSAVGGTVVLIAQVQGAASATVEFLVDNAHLATASAAPYQAAWDTSHVTAGNHLVMAVAVANGTTAQATAHVTVGMAGPIVAITKPVNDSVADAQVALEAQVTDDAAVSKVEFKIDGSTVGTATAAPYTATWGTAGLSDGTHLLQVTATDTESHTGSATRQLTLDRRPPSVSITSPTTGQMVQGTSVTLVADAADLNGILRVDFSVDSTSVGTSTSSPYSVTATLASGHHVAQAVAYDLAGNSTVSSTVSFSNGNTTGQCATKYDCLPGDICVGGQCQPAPTDGSCARDDQCPAGEICNFTHKCESGCSTNQDCTAPMICNQSTVTCEVCSRTNPCPSGQLCANGACVAQSHCSSTADCQGAEAGLVCAGGQCVNCTQDTDCTVAPFGSGYVCSSNGLCTAGGCTDASCQQMYGRLAYCDTTSKSCQQHQCVSNSDCLSGQTCALNTHTCSSSGCDVNTCNQNCMAVGMTCDPTTCSCSGGSTTCTTPGTGMAGSTCRTDCDCSTGLMCDTQNTLTCVAHGSGGVGAACATTADCASGETCVDTIIFGSVCAQVCKSAADCSSGAPCCPLQSGQSACSMFTQCLPG